MFELIGNIAVNIDLNHIIAQSSSGNGAGLS
jgi:hypothetical protein